MAAGHGLQVHFLWVTRDQKQFEWMVDLLRDVETRDTARLISTNIFITQFYDKFDIRTVMLVSYSQIANLLCFKCSTAGS